jgi:hypothetical protein
MTRTELEHIIRAAGTLADVEDLVVIGSQAVLGEFPGAPIDQIVTFRSVERKNIRFIRYQQFRGYAHGVGEETAILPQGWRDRLILVTGENTRFVRGWCLEVHDLAIAKHAAGWEKDRNLTRALVRHGMVRRNVLQPAPRRDGPNAGDPHVSSG